MVLEAGRDIKISATVKGTPYHIYAGDDGVISVNKKKQENKFLIDDPSELKTYPRLPLPIPTTPGGGTPTPKLSPIPLIIEIFRKFLDAGGTAPGHMSEINPMTAQPYADEAEFELVKKFTISQKRKLTQYLNDPRYELEFDYIKRRGKFDNQDQGCYGLPLTIHLGGNAYHDQYAEDVTNSPGDFLILPPTPVSGYAFMFYDGIVLVGSKATLASPAQSIGALAEVKTGYEAFNYIVNGNPRPERTGSNGQRVKSDLQLYNEVVDEIIREGLIAKFCHKDYFVSFDRKSVAESARLLLNSDSRILASGLSNIEVVHINSRPLVAF